MFYVDVADLGKHFLTRHTNPTFCILFSCRGITEKNVTKDTEHQDRKKSYSQAPQRAKYSSLFKSSLPNLPSRSQCVTDTISHSHLFGYKSGREMHTSSLDFTLHAEPHVHLKCVPGWGLNFNPHFKAHVVVIEKNWGRNIAVTTSFLKCWLFETVLNAVELD